MVILSKYLDQAFFIGLMICNNHFPNRLAVAFTRLPFSIGKYVRNSYYLCKKEKLISNRICPEIIITVVPALFVEFHFYFSSVTALFHTSIAL